MPHFSCRNGSEPHSMKRSGMPIRTSGRWTPCLEQRFGDERAEAADHDVVFQRHETLDPCGEVDHDLWCRTA